jgi:HKD family nuclease
MNVELHSERPHRPLSERLSEFLRDAVSVDIAVAFVSRFGAKEVQGIIDALHGRGRVRLLVSLLFPTHLDSIARLAEQIEVWLHLGHETSSEGLHGQFHSKLILVERANASRIIVIGSHNWTQNGLGGRNLEASVILTCQEDDAVVSQTRDHIKACREDVRCERFSASRLSYYKKLQQRYYPRMPRPRIRTRQLPFSGLIPFKALVILAEDHTGRGLTEAGVVFIRVPASWDEKPTTTTQIWLLVFEENALFGPRNQPCKAYRLQGTPDTVSRNPNRLNAGKSEYVIDNIHRPCVVPLRGASDLDLKQGEEWAVVNFHKKDEPELLPLFHAGDKDPSWRIREGFTDDLLAGAEDEERNSDFVRDVIARAILRVPFLQFAYPAPATVKARLEEYQEETSKEGERIAYAVELKEIETGISAYACSVTFKSDADLTEAVHCPGYA